MPANKLGTTWRTSAGATALLAAITIATLAPRAFAADEPQVELTTPSTQVYVNTPHSLDLRVTNCTQCEQPVMPAPPNCTIRFAGGPSRFESHSFINGRSTSEVYVTYHYVLTARKAGELVIPAVSVVVDGKAYKSEPLRLQVREAPRSPVLGDADDATNADDAQRLLLAEITCKQTRLFVGQRADFVLTIWIKPPAQGGRLLSQSRTLQLISGSFGPFKVDEVATSRVPLRQPNGGTETYYAIELPGEFTVDQPGPVDFSDVSISAKYPTRFRRGLFGDLSISSYQPLQIRPAVSVPDVQPLPEAGRPANFSGAVGRYRISMIAVPTNVRIGDPIELTITISGDPVEPLKQPDLTLTPGLADAFRIADSDLAGTVSGRQKRFKQTIRAKRTDVKEIPSIEFCYFDPISAEYTTARTRPVPLLVRAVERLDASDLGEIVADSPRTPATQLEVRDGLRGIKAAEGELLAQTPAITQTELWVATLAGPAFFAIVWASLALLAAKRDESTLRKRRALAVAEQRIRDAGADNLPPGEFHSRLAAALAGYLADRLDQPPARFLGADGAAALRDRNVKDELVEQYTEVLRRCEEAAYAGGGQGDPALAEAARQCVRNLERERL